MEQDLQGKTFIVTGANSGIGRATAGQLAQRGGKVFITARSEEKAKAVLDELGDRAAYLQLDLGDLDSVRRCEELGVTRVMTGPRATGARITKDDVIEWTRRFADEVIAKV